MTDKYMDNIQGMRDMQQETELEGQRDSRKILLETNMETERDRM